MKYPVENPNAHGEPENPQTPETSEAEQAEVCEVPVSSIEGAKVGDTVEFKVVSINQDAGTATIEPLEEVDNEEEGEGGTDGMAAQFDEAAASRATP